MNRYELSAIWGGWPCSFDRKRELDGYPEPPRGPGRKARNRKDGRNRPREGVLERMRRHDLECEKDPQDALEQAALAMDEQMRMWADAL